ncbi:lysoplasmalogenase-like protein TMEM86A isoform X2 [Paramacrobiotus metropolitanus]|uniref:lysoplasmalogenase-like protein TMEM86A isoform X2 n=1 Tax=Paramacrobiotus metropolitanus TaxID=2943436 RepID=UPI002445DB0A|nr:lysoplasmalogenase-like protein TMEM86A isoform X2 [Paramacrobiotus metropolitanus]
MTMFENYCGCGPSANTRILSGSVSTGPPRKPLRISRIIVLKSLGPQLIPFTQAACIYFVLFLPHDAISAVACFIKCLPIISLICFVILHGNVLPTTTKIGTDNPSTYSRWILAGLVFSAVGDAFLQFSAAGYFIPGMAAFGLAHVCYAVAFGVQPVHPLSGVIIFALAGSVFACLLPYLPGMFTYAVGVYLVLVSFMGWRAIARVPFLNDLWTWTKLACAVGALLFCLSDLMIAIKMFYSDFPLSQVLIMTTYYVVRIVL